MSIVRLNNGKRLDTDEPIDPLYDYGVDAIESYIYDNDQIYIDYLGTVLGAELPDTAEAVELAMMFVESSDTRHRAFLTWVADKHSEQLFDYMTEDDREYEPVLD